MNDPATHAPRTRPAGFTLVEMMVAMAILLFGLTALTGVLGVGVDTRRGAERLTVGAGVVDRITHELVIAVLPQYTLERVLASEEADAPDAEPAELLAIPPVTPSPVPGYPTMEYSVRFDVDPEWPELVLARILVRWRTQGEAQSEEFVRLLRRAAPLGARRAAARRAR